jgi:hypothetical protein
MQLSSDPRHPAAAHNIAHATKARTSYTDYMLRVVRARRRMTNRPHHQRQPVLFWFVLKPTSPLACGGNLEFGGVACTEAHAKISCGQWITGSFENMFAVGFLVVMISSYGADRAVCTHRLSQEGESGESGESGVRTQESGDSGLRSQVVLLVSVVASISTSTRGSPVLPCIQY